MTNLTKGREYLRYLRYIIIISIAGTKLNQKWQKEDHMHQNHLQCTIL